MIERIKVAIGGELNSKATLTTLTSSHVDVQRPLRHSDHSRDSTRSAHNAKVAKTSSSQCRKVESETGIAAIDSHDDVGVVVR